MMIVSLIVFLFGLIFIHELGHLLLAKYFKLKVISFSIGFGPRLFKMQIGETEYALRLFPIGGRVHILGEDLANSNKVSVNARSRSYAHQPPLRKALIAFGGPLANILFTLLVFAISPYLPSPEIKSLERAPIVQNAKGEKFILSNSASLKRSYKSLDNKELYQSNNLYLINLKTKDSQSANFIRDRIDLQHYGYYPGDLIIKKIEKGSVFDQYGIKKGALITHANGKLLDSFTDLVKIVKQNDGKTISMTLITEGKRLKFDNIPVNKGIGIHSAAKFLDLSGKIITNKSKNQNEFIGILQNYYDLFTGKVDIKELTGPIQIGSFAMGAYHYGIQIFIYFMAIISLNLAIVNLLPIPLLDGGHIFFHLIEYVLDKDISPKFYKVTNYIGLCCILSLVVVSLYNDITQLIV